MKKDEIIITLSQKVTSEILKQPKKIIEPNEKMISSGLIDSFSLVDLALLVEDLYGIRIEDTELNAQVFDTIEELSELILKRV